MLLHHQLSMRVGGKWPLHLPVRKRVECRTRDLHQSLIVKLSRAISRAAGEQQDPATARRLQRTASLNQVRWPPPSGDPRADHGGSQPCCPFVHGRAVMHGNPLSVWHSAVGGSTTFMSSIDCLT